MGHSQELEVATLDFVVREDVIVVFFPDDIVLGRVGRLSSLLDHLGHLFRHNLLVVFRTVVLLKVLPGFKQEYTLLLELFLLHAVIGITENLAGALDTFGVAFFIWYRELKLGKADKHLDVLGALQESVVQLARLFVFFFSDLIVYSGMSRSTQVL